MQKAIILKPNSFFTDIEISDFIKKLSSAELTNETDLGPYATLVDFTIGFRNVGNDIMAAFNYTNFKLSIVLTDDPQCNGTINQEFDAIYGAAERDKLKMGKFQPTIYIYTARTVVINEVPQSLTKWVIHDVIEKSG